MNIHFAQKELLGWHIPKYQRKNSLTGNLVIFFRNRIGFLIINISTIIFIILYFLDSDINRNFFEILIIFLLSLFIYYRSSIFYNEADRISMTIVFSIIIGLLVNFNDVMRLSICFVGTQGIFFYFINGCLKFGENGWRNGTYLKGILSTKQYSINLTTKLSLINTNYFFSFLSKFIIGWQMLFIFCPIMPIYFLLFFLIIGICFHLGISIFMGLNTFIFPFLATYPAILFLNITLQNIHIYSFLTEI